jgi:hypothetical protein
MTLVHVFATSVTLHVHTIVQAVGSVFWYIPMLLGTSFLLYTMCGHAGMHDLPAPLQMRDFYGYTAFSSMCLAMCVFYMDLTWDSVLEWIGSFVRNRYSALVDLDKMVFKKSELPCTSGKIVPSVCFMGGGHLWMFALGCGHYLWENYDLTECKFLASSCGCFAAVPLVLGRDPYIWAKSDWGKCLKHYMGRHWLLTWLNLGCLNDKKQFYYDLWHDYLPEDAHVRCSGRLFLSTTLYPSLKSKILSQFDSKDQLIWAIVGSICVPVGFIGDFPINIPGVGNVIDGGFSNDCPCLDSYTVTASALHNHSDISPRYLSKDILDDEYIAAPISFVDVLRTPSFRRVWQVARVGELAVENCPLMLRQEWTSRKKKNENENEKEKEKERDTNLKSERE